MPQEFTLPADLVHAIGAYLVERPYKEVAQLVALLTVAMQAAATPTEKQEPTI